MREIAKQQPFRTVRNVYNFAEAERPDKERGPTMTVLAEPVEQEHGEQPRGLSAPADFDGISLVFPDGTHALDEVSCSIAAGEFVSIIGPSGCGKSTLLKLASGLLSPTGGRMRVVDRVGYVFQDATLMPWRKVRANVELPAEMAGVPKSVRRKTAQEAIDLVGLGGFEEHYPHKLSGGMRMRVSLARALMTDAPLFLFDEPFGALDEITRERLNGEVLDLFDVKRFAAMFVTHSVYEAAYLSDRVIIMSPRPGRIHAEITVPFPRPRSPEIRFDPSFAALAGEISAGLRSAEQ